MSRNDQQPATSETAFVLPSAHGEGAAAALKRLQEFEVIHAARKQAAFESGDDLKIRFESEEYARCAQVLLKYEMEVTEAKRDLGHLIPKSEAVEGARAAARWIKLAIASWVSSCLPDIIAAGSSGGLREAKRLFQITFSEILAVSIKNSKNSREPVPDWAEQEIFEQWHLNLTREAKQVDPLQQKADNIRWYWRDRPAEELLPSGAHISCTDEVKALLEKYPAQ